MHYALCSILHNKPLPYIRLGWDLGSSVMNFNNITHLNQESVLEKNVGVESSMTSGTKGLIVYKGRILLILRDNKQDIPFPNTWEYVGGAKKSDESFEEAGLREVKEELGICPSNYVFLGIEHYPSRDAGRFIVLLSEAEYRKIRFGNEGQKFGFFRLDEAIELDMAPNLKKFLTVNYSVLKKIIDNNNPIEKDKFIFSNNSTT